MKKAISVILSVIIIITALIIPAGAAESTYTPDYDTETPVIIIHGMSQNDTYVLDENGQRIEDENGWVTGWPLEIEIMGLVKEALGPLLLSAFFKRDMGLCDAMKRGAYEGLPYIHKDNEGNFLTPVEVPCYEYPMGQMSEELLNYHYKLLPLKGLVDILGGDKVYYFGYDSFGDVIGETEKLHHYIHDVVLPQTGASQVKACFISLGGTIGVNYLDAYPEDYELFKKVEFVVPAIDGSDIIGDILTGNLSVMYDDNVLYEELLVKLLGDSYLAYILNIVLRILPAWLLRDALAALCEGLVEAGVRQTTTIWALCPTDYYEQARAMWLEDDEFAVIRNKADTYMKARADFEENIMSLKASGCEVFNIACHGNEMFPLCRDWKTTNGDGIVHSTSASMGAHFADVGETLGENYAAKGTYCNNPLHNHISPDNTVDATAGLLPCHTWYIKNQAHEKLPLNDVALKMAFDIMTDDNMKDVYSNPEKYPQFNEGRLTDSSSEYLEAWENADKSVIPADKYERAELAAQTVIQSLNETVVVTDEWNRQVRELRNALVDAGVIEDPSPSAIEDMFTDFMRSLNRGVNCFYDKIS